MAKRLAATVHAKGPDGERVILSPDDDLPKWATSGDRKLPDHVFESGDEADEPGVGEGVTAKSQGGSPEKAPPTAKVQG